jgi:TonB family protein
VAKKNAITVSLTMFILSARLSASAHAEEAKSIVPLTPSSDWNIEFGEDRCRLSRMFGPDDDKHIVYFEQAGPSTSFALTMAGKQLRIFKQHFNHLSLNPSDGFPRVDIQWGEIQQIGPAVTVLDFDVSQPPTIEGKNENSEELQSLPAIDLAEAGKIDRILFGHKGTAISFETGNLAAPFQALNACTSDLVRAWGLDQSQHINFKSQPRLKNEREIERAIEKRYPASARSRGQQAIMRVVAIIEADGSMSNCWLQNASQNDRFDSPACEIMKDAAFSPALDQNSKPMRSYYIKTLNYRIIPASAHG